MVSVLEGIFRLLLSLLPVDPSKSLCGIYKKDLSLGLIQTFPITFQALWITLKLIFAACVIVQDTNLTFYPGTALQQVNYTDPLKTPDEVASSLRFHMIHLTPRYVLG